MATASTTTTKGEEPSSSTTNYNSTTTQQQQYYYKEKVRVLFAAFVVAVAMIAAGATVLVRTATTASEKTSVLLLRRGSGGTASNNGRQSRVDGSSNKNNNTALDTTHGSALICQVSLNDFLVVSSNHNNDDDEPPQHELYVCNPVNATTGAVSSQQYTFQKRDLPARVMEEHDRRLQLDETMYIAIPAGQLNSRTAAVVVPDPYQVQVLDELPVSLAGAADHDHRKLRQPPSKGAVTILMLRIVARDSEPSYSAAELYRLHFQDHISVAAQFNRCSAGKLTVQPTQWGVLEVDIPIHARGNTYSAVMNAANDRALQLLGRDVTGDSSNIRDFAHMTVFIIPPGTGDWAAFATIRGKQSVFNDYWVGYVSALMHELGHNFGLYHANENGHEYGDDTGYMGMAAQVEGYPEKCYNGYNHWYLGWYDDRAADVQLSDSQPAVQIRLRPITDYHRALPGEYVLLKVGDLYMQYNRAKDFMQGTAEMIDSITVVRPVHKGTELLAGIDSRHDKYTGAVMMDGNKKKITIQCCHVVQTAHQDYVTVAVGYHGRNVCG